jgi:hypothetical protein
MAVPRGGYPGEEWRVLLDLKAQDFGFPLTQSEETIYLGLDHQQGHIREPASRRLPLDSGPTGNDLRCFRD